MNKISATLFLISLTFLISCESEEKKTFNDLNFAYGPTGDFDEGGHITYTTCHVAGPLETTAILLVKSEPQYLNPSPDCNVVDEFERGIVRVNVELITQIAGNPVPQTFSVAQLSDPYPQVGYFLPGDYILANVRKSGNQWFVNSSFFVYDDETPLRANISAEGYTYDIEIPTTVDELVDDAADVRANFEARCEGRTQIDWRLADDQRFYESMHKSREPKCSEVVVEEDDQSSELNTNNGSD